MGEVGDKRQPWVQEKDDYKLNVQYSLSYGDMDPVDRPLPPWYLPQGLSLMLPRLLPATEAKSYLVAGYVGSIREVMKRYVDVGAEQVVTLNGQQVRAIAITEHFGLQGAVTTHYVDRKGNWLGTRNAATKVSVLPSDKATLTQIWATQELQLDQQAEPAAPPANGPAGIPSASRPDSIHGAPGDGTPPAGQLPRRIGPDGR
jgi:hypothetical protein